jgi:hypothetical protein
MHIFIMEWKAQILLPTLAIKIGIIEKALCRYIAFVFALTIKENDLP